MAEVTGEPRVDVWLGNVYLIRDVWTVDAETGNRHLARCEYASTGKPDSTPERGFNRCTVDWRPCEQGVLYATIEPLVSAGQIAENLRQHQRLALEKAELSYA